MSVLAVSQTFLANSSVDSYECTAHSSLYNVPKHPKHPPPCVNKHGGVVASLLCQLSSAFISDGNIPHSVDRATAVMFGAKRWSRMSWEFLHLL